MSPSPRELARKDEWSVGLPGHVYQAALDARSRSVPSEHIFWVRGTCAGEYEVLCVNGSKVIFFSDEQAPALNFALSKGALCNPRPGPSYTELTVDGVWYVGN